MVVFSTVCIKCYIKFNKNMLIADLELFKGVASVK